MDFFELNMLQKIDAAKQKVKQILSQNKNPQLASDVDDSTYDDKFSLTEFLIQMSMASQVACIVELGLTEANIGVLNQWSVSSTVTLRFRTEERCVLLRTDTRQEDSNRMSVVEGDLIGRVTSKVCTCLYVSRVPRAKDIDNLCPGGDHGEGLCVEIHAKLGADCISWDRSVTWGLSPPRGLPWLAHRYHLD